MMHSSTLTVRLDDKLKQKLEKLAHSTHRSKSFLAADAIQQYLQINEWQISEIKKGLVEADSGELVDHEQVIKKWSKRFGNTLDKKGRTKS